MIHFSVYVNGTFLCTGDAQVCMMEAKNASIGNNKAEIVFDHNYMVKTFINGNEVTYREDSLKRI